MIKGPEIGRLSRISPEGQMLRVLSRARQKDDSQRRPCDPRDDKVTEKLEAAGTERSDQITGEKQTGVAGGGC